MTASDWIVLFTPSSRATRMPATYDFGFLSPRWAGSSLAQPFAADSPGLRAYDPGCNSRGREQRARLRAALRRSVDGE